MATSARLLSVAALLASAAAVAGLSVLTTYGPVFTNTISTAASGTNVTVFRRIPFAAPPVGNLRFHAPVSPTPWTAPLDASELGAICPQLKLGEGLFLGSEDCLNLQVYIPDACQGKRCPVYVYIYGGAWVVGDSEEFGKYDATNLAANLGAVVVAPNYRVGAFGFMALSALQAEDPDGSTGNAALQDQVAALQWVRDNIAAFSGDPGHVTIGGESAGAFSVCWHLVSRASAGLFHAAIMESGTCDAPQFYQPLPDAINFNSIYASALGCPPNATGPVSQPPAAPRTPGASTNGQLLCLRALSTGDVMQTLSQMLSPGDLPAPAGTRIPPLWPVMPWGAAIDGSDAGLLDVPLSLMQGGKFNRVPLILGTNKDEGSMFVPLFPFMMTGIAFPPRDQDFVPIVQHAFDMYPAATVVNLTQHAILPLYPASAYPGGNASNWLRATDVVTHCFFTASTRRTARAFADAGVPVYLYRFSFPLKSLLGTLLLGDYHSSELAYVFQHADPSWNADDAQVEAAFSTWWRNHVAFHDPNGAGGVGNSTGPIPWPTYQRSSEGEANMEIALPFSLTFQLEEEQLDAWDEFYYTLRDLPHSQRSRSGLMARLRRLADA